MLGGNQDNGLQHLTRACPHLLAGYVADSGALSDASNRPGRDEEEEDRGRGKLYPPLSLPKNRSTGNLHGAPVEPMDRSQARMSLDATSAVLDYDTVTR